ncbi:hypothetical protein HDU86_001285 [Geranomyces michiganensis]|nr:hypothetical protein HDU86_001285 [Geranomyces michiganensis]
MSDLPECCKTGYLHDVSAAGGLRGSEQVRHGLPVYISRPANVSGATTKKKAVIVLSDVFGWKYPNTRILADRFAAQGYTAFLPDLFNGGALPYQSYSHIIANPEPPRGIMQHLVRATHLIKAVPTAVPFLLKYARKQPLPGIEAFARGLRSRKEKDAGVTETNATSGDDDLDDNFDVVVAVGYCFGGRYACLLGAATATAHDGDNNGQSVPTIAAHNPLVSAVAVVHPGEIKVPDEITAINVPALFLHSIGDPFFPARAAAEQALVEKNKSKNPQDHLAYEFVDYDRPHGFALRADIEEGVAREAMEDALRRCLDWFAKHG